MLFYCPNCRNEFDVEPKETIQTKNNRIAYKANCPVCGQDMAEFVPEDKKSGEGGQVTATEHAQIEMSAETDQISHDGQNHLTPGNNEPEPLE